MSKGQLPLTTLISAVVAIAMFILLFVGVSRLYASTRVSGEASDSFTELTTLISGLQDKTTGTSENIPLKLDLQTAIAFFKGDNVQLYIQTTADTSSKIFYEILKPDNCTGTTCVCLCKSLDLQKQGSSFACGDSICKSYGFDMKVQVDEDCSSGNVPCITFSKGYAIARQIRGTFPDRQRPTEFFIEKGNGFTGVCDSLKDGSCIKWFEGEQKQAVCSTYTAKEQCNNDTNCRSVIDPHTDQFQCKTCGVDINC